MSEAAVTAGVAAGDVDLRPGRALADARASRNLTVAEVAQQLRLSVTQVEALEAEAYERLPGPVFVRGFVRNYARLLGLDAAALLAAINPQQVPEISGATISLSHDIPFPEPRRSNWLPYAVGLAVIISAVLVFEIFISATPTVVVAPVSPQRAVALPVLEPALPVQAMAPARLLPGEVAAAAAPTVETVVAQAPAAQSAGMVELHFKFATSSWVEVRDRNDRILISQLHVAGAEQRVEGRPPFQVVVGNARGVRLTYNGQPFDMAPHTRVEVARFTLE